VFIQTEETPNPETLKFIPGRTVMEKGTATYRNISECSNSPLAQRLLKIDDIIAVFFAHDFITLTKKTGTEWYVLKPLLLGILLEHFVANLPIIVEEISVDVAPSENDQDPLVIQIRELLDTRIRPAVAQDGGDITFHDFKDGVVYLKMQGACSGCPSSQATLKTGIENMLRYYVPEVTEVRAVND